MQRVMLIYPALCSCIATSLFFKIHAVEENKELSTFLGIGKQMSGPIAKTIDAALPALGIHSCLTQNQLGERTIQVDT